MANPDPFGAYAKKVTIKNGPTTAAQRDILARAIRYAEKVHAPYKAKVALLTGLIQESEATNLSTPSADGYGSYGVMQGLVRYQSKAKLMSPEYQFGVFLGTVKNGDGNYNGFTGKGGAIKLSKTGMTTGQIAQAVNGSAYPERYQTTSKEAQKILKLYSQGSGSSGGSTPGAPVNKTTGGTAAPASMDANAANLQALYSYARNKNRGAKLTDLAATLGANNAAASAAAAAAAPIVPTVVKPKVSKSSSGSSAAPSTAAGAAGANGRAKGLSPTVLKAIAFARANGWKGQINSGFRTYAEQVVLYNRYKNGTGGIAAKPGQSNHESGNAIDVSDYQGFNRAMQKAPKGARLKWYGPGDTVHFSITGR